MDKIRNDLENLFNQWIGEIDYDPLELIEMFVSIVSIDQEVRHELEYGDEEELESEEETE